MKNEGHTSTTVNTAIPQQERVVRPDGHYDNTQTMRRECWRDGKLVAWWTAEIIQLRRHPWPEWGSFQDVPRPNEGIEKFPAA